MKMKHVMAALLFGVVAAGAAQAEEEKYYRYYPYSMEAFYTGILASKDLNKGCEIGLDNYNKYVLNKQNDEGAGAKYKKPWTDYTRNDHPHRQIMCSYKRHSYLGNGKWSPWVDAEYVLTGITCYDGGRFLWRDKNLCAEEVDKKDVVVCDPSFHEDGKVPEGCPPPPPPKNPCDPSYYPNGIVPEDCPKNKPDEKTCEKAREELRKNNIPLTKGCSEFPPNKHALCDSSRYRSNGYGVTSCDQNNKLFSCVLYDQFPRELTDPQAKQILWFCTDRHETIHVKDSRLKCKDGELSYTNGNDGRFASEIDAYQDTIDCLDKEIKNCGSNSDCVEQLGFLLDEAEREKLNNETLLYGPLL